MTRNGKIQNNGVLILDDGTRLPDGTRVRVEPLEEPAIAERDNGELSALFTIGRRAVHTGMPDLAINHDHYLYGHPKVTDEQRWACSFEVMGDTDCHEALTADRHFQQAGFRRLLGDE